MWKAKALVALTSAAARCPEIMPYVLESFANRTEFAIELLNHAGHQPATFATVPPQLSPDKAAEYAAAMRREINAGDVEPLYHLGRLLSSKLQVFVLPETAPGIASAGVRLNGFVVLFISNDDSVDALRACARIFGHLLLLPARSRGDAGAIIETWQQLRRTPTGRYERFADVFAAELLIPTRGLGIALKQVRAALKIKAGALGDVELLYLARIFGVSFLSMARRCEHAHLLPKGGSSALYQFLCKSFGGPEERADSLGLPARPQFAVEGLPTSAAMAIRDGLRTGRVSLDDMSAKLRWPRSSLEAALSMPTQH